MVLNPNHVYVGTMKMVTENRHVEYKNVAVEDDVYVADHVTQIVVIPEMTTLSAVINVTVEFYSRYMYTKRAGIPSRDGWHEAPVYRYRFDKKPYSSSIYSISQFNSLFGDIELQELV